MFSSQWYCDHLGVAMVPSNYGESPWQQEAGPTAFAPFPETTDYLGEAGKVWMINFRVRNLDAMVAQLARRRHLSSMISNAIRTGASLACTTPSGTLLSCGSRMGSNSSAGPSALRTSLALSNAFGASLSGIDSGNHGSHINRAQLQQFQRRLKNARGGSQQYVTMK